MVEWYTWLISTVLVTSYLLFRFIFPCPTINWGGTHRTWTHSDVILCACCMPANGVACLISTTATSPPDCWLHLHLVTTWHTTRLIQANFNKWHLSWLSSGDSASDVASHYTSATAFRSVPLHRSATFPFHYTAPFHHILPFYYILPFHYTVPLRFCSTTQLRSAALPFNYILRFRYIFPFHNVLPFQCITPFQYRFVRRTVSSLPLCLLTIC